MVDKNELPMVINPEYIQQRYVYTLAELEEIFGDLRNADDETRLKIVQELLDQADEWLTERYSEAGVYDEDRVMAALIEAQILDEYRKMADPQDD